MARKVVDQYGNSAENLDYLAGKLGQGGIAHGIFNVIYGRKRKPQTLTEIHSDKQLKEFNKQSVRNKLTRMASWGLIGTGEKKDNEVTYYRLPFVDAEKNTIRDLAINPGKREKLATKRRPASLRPKAKITLTKRAPLVRKIPKKVTVAIVSSDPNAIVGKRLRTDIEARLIKDRLSRAEYRDIFQVEIIPAASLGELIDALRNINPDILHFSGHSGVDGIKMEGDISAKDKKAIVTYENLAKAISLSGHRPRVLVLSSCISSSGKVELVDVCDCLISTIVSINDDEAAIFSGRLYYEFASGSSLRTSFENARLVSVAESTHAEIYEANFIDDKLQEFVFA